jgi:anaerobic selenocysteine-containing dehydrogenase
VIAVLVGQGYRPKQCCRILAVAPAGYFVWKRGPISGSVSGWDLRGAVSCALMRGTMSSHPGCRSRGLSLRVTPALSTAD